jgi:prolyl-tRNA editing enzyme YbaK/EbsC (Cys-tRNA(Pro) deacylase)
MSLQSAHEFLAQYAPDIQILEKSTSTATVVEAAEAHGVEPVKAGVKVGQCGGVKVSQWS